ncbi:hypothetical protein H2198_005194 [Neophaeococcomyces mojaviensis]|uniref:Uncharacterized protein n=1 Tax=Neophaeococcomyces mojaviensis TaxID=3383035 RepID=A0ACC3A6F8_9EURO|nr:hypothetical protein H2198_005194 [Knufia sp. JES_112]
MPSDGGQGLKGPDLQVERRQHDVTKIASDVRYKANSKSTTDAKGARTITNNQTTKQRHNHQLPPEVGLNAKPLLSKLHKRKRGDSAPVPTPSVPAELAQPSELTFYPAYCHSASPTWFTWVKLTAHDIHNKIQEREGYQHVFQTEYAQDHSRSRMLFYLNHPIQFVQVIGVVVNLEEFFEKFWLFTVDDSSGATIDIVCRKAGVKKEQGMQSWNGTANIIEHADKVEADEAEKEAAELSRQVEAVKIGTVLQIKGTITLFQRYKATNAVNGLNNLDRAASASVAHVHDDIHADQSTRQISLSRLSIVHSTTEEMSLIEARANFHRFVLSNPWALTQKEVQKLHRKALGDAEHERSKVKRHREKGTKSKKQEEQDADQIQAEYEEEDRLRSHEANLAKQAGEWLKILRQQQQELKNTTIMNGSPVALDEKSALLRAAFG